MAETREALAIKYAVQEIGDLDCYDFLDAVLHGEWNEIPEFVAYCANRGVDVFAPERQAAEPANG